MVLALVVGFALSIKQDPVQTEKDKPVWTMESLDGNYQAGSKWLRLHADGTFRAGWHSDTGDPDPVQGTYRIDGESIRTETSFERFSANASKEERLFLCKWGNNTYLVPDYLMMSYCVFAAVKCKPDTEESLFYSRKGAASDVLGGPYLPAEFKRYASREAIPRPKVTSITDRVITLDKGSAAWILPRSIVTYPFGNKGLRNWLIVKESSRDSCECITLTSEDPLPKIGTVCLPSTELACTDE